MRERGVFQTKSLLTLLWPNSPLALKMKKQLMLDKKALLEAFLLKSMVKADERAQFKEMVGTRGGDEYTAAVMIQRVYRGRKARANALTLKWYLKFKKTALLKAAERDEGGILRNVPRLRTIVSPTCLKVAAAGESKASEQSSSKSKERGVKADMNSRF